jgi:hypothetical protein
MIIGIAMHPEDRGDAIYAGDVKAQIMLLGMPRRLGAIPDLESMLVGRALLRHDPSRPEEIRQDTEALIPFQLDAEVRRRARRRRLEQHGPARPLQSLTSRFDNVSLPRCSIDTGMRTAGYERRHSSERIP